MALDQRGQLVEFETLEQERLLATLGYGVSELKDHVTFAMPFLIGQNITDLYLFKLSRQFRCCNLQRGIIILALIANVSECL